MKFLSYSFRLLLCVFIFNSCATDNRTDAEKIDLNGLWAFVDSRLTYNELFIEGDRFIICHIEYGILDNYKIDRHAMGMAVYQEGEGKYFLWNDFKITRKGPDSLYFKQINLPDSLSTTLRVGRIPNSPKTYAELYDFNKDGRFFNDFERRRVEHLKRNRR